MGEEKAYCGDAEERSQRQGYQRKFRGDMNRLSWAMLYGGREGRRDEGTRCSSQEARGPKGKKWLTKCLDYTGRSLWGTGSPGSRLDNSG